MDNFGRRLFGTDRERNIVIVSHGFIIRMLVMRYFRLSVEEFNVMKNPDNCEMWILERNATGQYIF
jgi:broad specificity phosphatase PhoE